MTFTKEQLIARLEQHKETAASIAPTVRHLPVAHELALMDIHLSEMALAGMEAKPVEWRVAFRLDGQPGSDFEKTFENQPKMNEIISLHERAGFSASITPLYAAQPVPVAAPDEVMSSIEHLKQTLVNCNRYNYCSDAVKRIENACLAAMLQGADGNSPAIPDGCCIMPMKLTAENGAKGALSGEFHVTHHIVCQSCGGEGCEDCNEEGGWDGEILIGWDTIKRIHDAAVEACALPAAPQQEVKP